MLKFKCRIENGPQKGYNSVNVFSSCLLTIPSAHLIFACCWSQFHQFTMNLQQEVAATGVKCTLLKRQNRMGEEGSVTASTLANACVKWDPEPELIVHVRCSANLPDQDWVRFPEIFCSALAWPFSVNISVMSHMSANQPGGQLMARPEREIRNTHSSFMVLLFPIMLLFLQ